jgi:hypothetical protein
MQARARKYNLPTLRTAGNAALLCARDGMADTPRAALVMTSVGGSNTWANVTGGATLLANAVPMQFDFAIAPISLTITINNATGTAPGIAYKIGNAANVFVASPTTITLQPTDTLRVAVSNATLACTGTMSFSGVSGIPSIPYTCT